MSDRWAIHHGDCREVMRAMEPESIDSIVSDPPYGLSFMGKGWDHGVPGVEFWEAALRVAKPGAHLLAFGGTRTFHRLTVAIEDAGWEIRDCLMWVYGSGFPKSHDVSKAIDREAGAEREKVRVKAENVRNPKATGSGKDGAPGATRPWIENALKAGFHEKDGDTPATDAARQWSGWGTALKPSHEPVILARKPLSGTVAANVLEHGTGALNVDGCRVEPESGDEPLKWQHGRGMGFHGAENRGPCAAGISPGRWPANLIHDGSEEVVGLFPSPHGAGARRDAGQVKHGEHSSLFGISGHESNGMRYGDAGSAARFFYCPKASKADRGDGNHHPTVKPTDLMRYLCRLVTPPDGLVFDPFTGSGSTGKAAMLEGFRFVGAELSPEYIEIARARIGHAAGKTRQKELALA